jgi:hypothetical protein
MFHMILLKPLVIPELLWDYLKAKFKENNLMTKMVYTCCYLEIKSAGLV